MQLPGAPVFIDERQVRRAFDRAAPAYAAHADIEREIGRRMLARLDYVRIDPRRIIDFGCGPDMATAALRARYREARIVGVDLSEAMLRAGTNDSRRLRWALPQFSALFKTRHKVQKTCAHAAQLPLRAEIAQLVWSNLMLLWCNDPVAVIGEMHRVLEPGGLVMFSSLGPDTLKELRAAFTDGHTHVQRFVDMHDLGDMLVRAGFADPVMDMEMLTLEYPSVDRLLADLRSSGAGNSMDDRLRGLGGRKAWAQARERLDAGRRNGAISVTLEVVYGHAWKTAPRGKETGASVVRFMPKPGS